MFYLQVGLFSKAVEDIRLLPWSGERTEPRPQVYRLPVASNENMVKLGRVRYTSGQNRQTDRQTDRHAHGNAILRSSTGAE